MNRSRLLQILNWSVKVGRLFGIPISLHISIIFFLLPALTGRGLGPVLGLEFALGVVASILLHELGHALVAKRYRLTDISITLHGFGGFAISSGYRSPTQSLVISLAGPAVTFALGGLCFGIGSISLEKIQTEALLNQMWLVKQLGVLNLWMGFLNLMPSFPFDGGNALRAILNRRQTEFSATRTVGHIGLVVGPAIFLYGFFAQRNFIAIFGLMGFLTSLTVLMDSGGVRFKDLFAERTRRMEKEVEKRRADAKSDVYISAVRDREKERAERDRLRKILESSLDEE
jgi:Zn-dependent protease